MHKNKTQLKVPIEINGNSAAKRSDLVELVLSPLAEQIERARLELVSGLRQVSESLDMMARQTRRQLDKNE